MATQREIKKRISSVTNTKKITKTMEMVATAKMKKMQDRLNRSKPYIENLARLISDLQLVLPDEAPIPLFREKETPNIAMILMISGNRGLCGGFNNAVIENTMEFRRRLIEDEEKEVIVYAIGKKAISFYSQKKIDLYKSMHNLEDKGTVDDSELLANELIDLFIKERVDEVYVSYTKVLSLSSYKPVVEKLLPISLQEFQTLTPVQGVDYICEPDVLRVLNVILPLYIRVKLFQVQVESGYAEQLARRIAMKNATDAAGDMIRALTLRYNRVRQAKITNEIAEIVGGASALEG